MVLFAETEIPYPLPLVFSTYRDRLEEIVPYLPNIECIQVQQRSENENIAYLVNAWTSKRDLPLLVQKFLKTDAFRWTDRAEWNASRWICSWSVQTEIFPGLVECWGTTSFVDVSSTTRIRIDGELQLHLEKLHVPRFLANSLQPLIEKFVVNALKPNLLSAGEGVGKFLLNHAN
jgi:hypothetical protein